MTRNTANVRKTSFFALDNIIGISSWAQRIRRRVIQVANYRYSVLISGPSGTGKELLARAIHAHGPRSNQPFIPINCAAIPGPLLASQLFGHVSGACTGARGASLGCIRSAAGGTVFLNEVGELDQESQGKLLQVLKCRKVVPVGGEREIPAGDVRFIAATNRDLEEDVRTGRFRLDLYYRLSALPIETLSLLDRPEDIVPLAGYFIARAAIENGLPMKRLTPGGKAVLESYDWPGNVRELREVVERAILFSDDDQLDAGVFQSLLSDDVNTPWLADRMSESRRENEPKHQLDWSTLADVEAEHIRRTLKETSYDEAAAARLLGVDRQLLAWKIKELGIAMPRIRDAAY